jgi:hypothetical protein
MEKKRKSGVAMNRELENMKYHHSIVLSSFNNMSVRINTASASEVSTIVSVIGEEEINRINMIRSIMG